MRRLQGSQASEGTGSPRNKNRDTDTWVAADTGSILLVNSGIMEWMGHVMTTGESHGTGSEATATIFVKGYWLPPGCW